MLPQGHPVTETATEPLNLLPQYLTTPPFCQPYSVQIQRLLNDQAHRFVPVSNG